MKTNNRYGKPLIIACQSPKASDLSTGQQDKAALGLWELDDLQMDAVRFSRLIHCGGLLIFMMGVVFLVSVIIIGLMKDP